MGVPQTKLSTIWTKSLLMAAPKLYNQNQRNPNWRNVKPHEYNYQKEQQNMEEKKIDLPFNINSENFSHQQIGDHHIGPNLGKELPSTPRKRKL